MVLGRHLLTLCLKTLSFLHFLNIKREREKERKKKEGLGGKRERA